MSDTQHRRSLWLGALCSTLAAGLVLLAIVLLSQPRVPSVDKLFTGIGVLFLLATPVSLVATICLGLPLVFLLRSLKAFTWLTVCLGASVGVSTPQTA